MDDAWACCESCAFYIRPPGDVEECGADAMRVMEGGGVSFKRTDYQPPPECKK